MSIRRLSLIVALLALLILAYGFGQAQGAQTSKVYLPVAPSNKTEHAQPSDGTCGTATAEMTDTAVIAPTVAVTDTAVVSPTATATPSPTVAVGTAEPTVTGTIVVPTTTPSITATPTVTVPDDVLEPFEGAATTWQVSRDIAGSGALVRSGEQVAAGSFAAKASTAGQGGRAQVRVDFADIATDHTWEERPGTWHWQRTSVYVPSATVAQLGANDYLTLAGMWSNGAGYGWFLRVRQGGELYVVGSSTTNNAQVEFRVYGTLPQDRWFELETGLHTQAGPGVKRAFVFLVDGAFYGWYRQGRMEQETYDRAAVGILDTNSSAPLNVYIDRWQRMSTGQFPGGPDSRPTSMLQEQDYRTMSGVQVQYDWSTWENELLLHPQYGLYSLSNRLQAGRNIDRMPDLTSGWAEIEIDWPNGTPPVTPDSYFGPMVGFRKEINREENLEVIPIGKGNGQVDLALEAWVDSPVILATWPMPAASFNGNSHIPEPGDIIRARWEQVNATTLNVRASYYDASTNTWYPDIINGNYNITNVNNGSTDAVNYTDGFHTASSITIDSQFYAIRRFKVGALVSYP